MLRNYAAEASALLTRWRRGEDVQDAIAHQLRYVSAGLNTLQAEVVTLREDKARLDKLDTRGVQSIYFNDGGQMNPGLMNLRSAIDCGPL